MKPATTIALFICYTLVVDAYSPHLAPYRGNACRRNSLRSSTPITTTSLHSQIDDSRGTDTPGTSNLLPAHPEYSVKGRLPNAESGDFVLTREGEPREEEFSNQQMLRILEFEEHSGKCTDLEVNTLLWKCLGYRFDPEKEEWDNTHCFPNWKKQYPEPPDFIGMQRIYSKEVDNPSLRANQALCKTIPVAAKQSLKDNLRSYGFTGFKLADLTPNKTRRAQSCNWLLYYRDNLFGRTIEELLEEKRLRKEAEEKAIEEREKGGEEDVAEKWSPPFKPVL